MCGPELRPELMRQAALILIRKRTSIWRSVVADNKVCFWKHMHCLDPKKDMGHMISTNIVICRDCHRGLNPTVMLSLSCPWVSMCALTSCANIRNTMGWDQSNCWLSLHVTTCTKPARPQQSGDHVGNMLNRQCKTALCDCQHEWSIVRNFVVYNYALWFDSLCSLSSESSLCV